MKQNRLFKKLVTLFLCFVLLPFMLLLIALFWHANRLQLENDIAQNENLTLQTISSVRKQTELAENMCKTIIQNPNLIHFLDKQYETTPDLFYYQTTIRDFVKATNGVSDIKLRIFLENPSIPMGFGIFYPIDYIDSTPDFTAFYHSDAESAWLRDPDGSCITKLSLPNRENSHHFMHKILIGSRCIGIIDAAVPNDVYTVTDPLSSEEVSPVDLGHCQMYNYSGRELRAEETEAFTAAPGTGHTQELIYTLKETLTGPSDVLVVTQRSRVTHMQTFLLLSIPLLFAALITVFFLYNQHVIRDIHSCLDEMELAIENNFKVPQEHGPLPINAVLQRHDEISTLARRINYLLQEIRTLLEQEIQQQTAAKETQLLALQHQINPHFLYNTMEVFSSRMELAGLYEESGAISAFCRMLRYNMNTKEPMVTLADEIQQVKYYLAIQKIRKIPFAVNFDIPDELLHERTIRFLLEPFVENSFKYRRLPDPLHICISARAVGKDMELVIRNNGEPLPTAKVQELNERFANAPASLETNGEHIGLNNINSRLKLFYGDDHFIRVECTESEICFRFLLERKPPVSEPYAPTEF